MTIEAKVVAHSTYLDNAPDLITLQLRYPRFIHSEFMTHRVFSRNASSSRAVPIARMIRDVIEDPAMPVAWGSNKPGMQAGEELSNQAAARDTWLDARDAAVRHAQRLADMGAHKQIVNRVLEPFAHISVVVTSSEWDNFFALRCHPDADPTIRTLADAMQQAISASGLRRHTIAHLPYVHMDEMPQGMVLMKDYYEVMMVSAARCARVSYLNHDGTQCDRGKDLALADRLFASRHMSPFEHQALATLNTKFRSRNFTGWQQHREIIEKKEMNA